MKIWEFARQLEDVDIVSTEYDGISDVTYTTSEGWKFQVFFDGGELDYIQFIWGGDGNKLDISEAYGGMGSYFARNFICVPDIADKLTKLAKACPNWDYT